MYTVPRRSARLVGLCLGSASTGPGTSCHAPPGIPGACLAAAALSQSSATHSHAHCEAHIQREGVLAAGWWCASNDAGDVTHPARCVGRVGPLQASGCKLAGVPTVTQQTSRRESPLSALASDQTNEPAKKAIHTTREQSRREEVWRHERAGAAGRACLAIFFVKHIRTYEAWISAQHSSSVHSHLKTALQMCTHQQSRPSLVAPPPLCSTACGYRRS
eukprot:COSAG03_NODE_146_length_11610_cov_7.478586_12_plen_218_part_00